MQPAQRNSVLLIGLLAGAGWLNSMIGNFGTPNDSEVHLPELPARVGEWSGRAFDFSDPSFADFTGSRLGGRRYTNPRGETVDVFLVGTARFDQFHTPEYCYLSNGYKLVDERAETLSVAGKRIQAKRMDAVSSQGRQDVLFWFQTGERTTQHRALIKLAAFGRILVGKRPEPLLMVRFSTLLRDGESPLDRFVPRVLFFLEQAGVASSEPGPIRSGGTAPL